MILVDTSIWIGFLSNRPPFAAHLDALLERGDVIGHELAFGELLIGDRGGRAPFLASYAKIQQAPTLQHHEVVTFVRYRKLHGRGAGWIDIHLLASALTERLRLWTADSRLATLASELGVHWQP
jgi:predicted nucleic acid-binding protein